MTRLGSGEQIAEPSFESYPISSEAYEVRVRLVVLECLQWVGTCNRHHSPKVDAVSLYFTIKEAQALTVKLICLRPHSDL